MTTAYHAHARIARIDIEAEKGTCKAPIQVFSSDLSSGGKCIGSKDAPKPKPDECGGSCTLTFNVPADGTYTLWARCRWLDNCGDSFYLKMDNGSKRKFGEIGSERDWRWYKAPTNNTYTLSAGQHTLVVSGREDGALMDKILLTTNKNYTPQGKNG